VNPALAGVALAVVVGGVFAGSTRDARAAVLGLVVVLVGTPFVADPLPEPTETFAVHLSGATGAAIGRANGVGTILDDD